MARFKEKYGKTEEFVHENNINIKNSDKLIDGVKKALVKILKSKMPTDELMVRKTLIPKQKQNINPVK